MLAGVASGEDVPIVNRSVDSIGWGCQSVRLASGWRLRVWWFFCGAMGPLSGAMAPDGRRWDYGCDRWPDWEAGSKAVILDPFRHLITPEQREMIAERLSVAEVQPPPEIEVEAPLLGEIWTDEELIEMGGAG